MKNAHRNFSSLDRQRKRSVSSNLNDSFSGKIDAIKTNTKTTNFLKGGVPEYKNSGAKASQDLSKKLKRKPTGRNMFSS